MASNIGEFGMMPLEDWNETDEAELSREDNYTGIIVEPGSPEEIAKGIIRYYQIKEKINFKSNIEEYLSQGDFNKLPELFDQIISEAG